MAIRILIVDDDISFLNDISGKLGKTYYVMRADNASDARQKLKQEKVDVVILDMNLRETADSTVDSDPMGGVKILQELDNVLASRTIFLSIYLTSHVIVQAVKAGCRYVLFKQVKSESEEAFYTTLMAYIDVIGRKKRILWRFLITFASSIIILVGIAVAWVGYSATAGLLISTTGVILNLLSFYPKSLR